MEKRRLPGDGGEMVPLPEAKQPRTAEGALVSVPASAGALALSGPQRTSDLLAPIMLLSGHSGAVLTTKFSPDGQHLLSGSHDKLVLLWEVFGECKNLLTFRGHANAVLEVHWSSDSENAFTASADKTAAMWDTRTGGRARQFKGHSSYVNSCCPANEAPFLCTGSDDRTVRLWDTRMRSCQRSLEQKWPVTAVSCAHDGMRVYSGGLDGSIRVYDLRRPDEEELVLSGHQDIVTGLRLSPDGNALLSNSMDNTMRCWDVKPYVAGDRCEKIFRGAQHNYEKGLLKCSWSKNASQVAAGSADNFVYVWNAETGRIVYKLPGHKGTVNEVDFHPTQPIISSCSNDKQIYLGEIRG
ncbi:hypothetical protein AB1Y20_012705 [Prymnesium parvum]|uniref:Uncharacterized protein n=1 Tax=Prymnesium parvum TaxID=97485 RepID=A0AB34IJG7_PRYPA